MQLILSFMASGFCSLERSFHSNIVKIVYISIVLFSFKNN